MILENPDGIIKVRFDGFLSCLLIENPRVVDWPDYGGTIARYYACLPKGATNYPLAKDIDEKISILTSVEDLKESGFLSLLESGEYEIELWEDKPASLLFNTNIYNTNKLLYQWSNEAYRNNRLGKPYLLNSFYPYGRQLMFTQPFESLDPSRIDYYETRIKNGERPKAISLRVKGGDQLDEDSYQETEVNTTKYVLDGHHKLVAYKNLKINPSYFVINRINRGFDESELPNLENYLFYSQIEHIVNNGLNSMRHSESMTSFIDNWINKSPRIEDDLVITLYENAIYPRYQSDPQKRKWFAERLDVLISKFNNGLSEVDLDYYCRLDFRRKYTKVKKWGEVLDVLQLNKG